jgi:hypothetical protein
VPVSSAEMLDTTSSEQNMGWQNTVNLA